jgi:hypothetical protein
MIVAILLSLHIALILKVKIMHDKSACLFAECALHALLLATNATRHC